MIRLVRLLCLLLFGASVTAAPFVSGAAEVDFTEPVLRLPPIRTAPVIDGEIGEEEWGSAILVSRVAKARSLRFAFAVAGRSRHCSMIRGRTQHLLITRAGFGSKPAAHASLGGER